MSVKDLSEKRKTTVDRPYESIGNRIRDWRMKNNILQAELIEAGAPTKITALRLMEGGVRAPSVDFLMFLRKKYQLDLNFIVMGE